MVCRYINNEGDNSLESAKKAANVFGDYYLKKFINEFQ